MSTEEGQQCWGAALSLHRQKAAADKRCLYEGLVTLSVNHAPVEDPGHHAALLVVELQCDSLEDRKIHDCSLEERAPRPSAKSSPCPCPQKAVQGLGRSPTLGQPSLLQLLLAQASPPIDGAPSRSPGRIQHPLPMAEVSSDLLHPLTPARWHSSTCPTAPPGGIKLWDLASSHHGLLRDLLELDEAYLPHLTAVAVGRAAQGR